MLKYILHSIFILITLEMAGQKVMERSWQSSSFEQISIDSDEVFSIKAMGVSSSEIELKVKASGEYSEYVVLTISEEKNHLSISTGYAPYFVAANDKLAAHKVMSIQIEIKVPESMPLAIRAKVASFLGEGSLQSLSVVLNEGRCVLTSFIGNAALETHYGDINVSALENVGATALSSSGTVSNGLPASGTYKIEAESVNGNITLVLDP